MCLATNALISSARTTEGVDCCTEPSCRATSIDTMAANSSMVGYSNMKLDDTHCLVLSAKDDLRALMILLRKNVALKLSGISKIQVAC